MHRLRCCQGTITAGHRRVASRGAITVGWWSSDLLSSQCSRTYPVPNERSVVWMFVLARFGDSVLPSNEVCVQEIVYTWKIWVLGILAFVSKEMTASTQNLRETNSVQEAIFLLWHSRDWPECGDCTAGPARKRQVSTDKSRELTLREQQQLVVSLYTNVPAEACYFLCT